MIAIERRRARLGHRRTYDALLRLRAGEALVIGRVDNEFPGWRWVDTADARGGWAPLKVIAAGSTGPVARYDYDAREIDLDPGDTVDVLESVSGWLRVRHDANGEGWVPGECFEDRPEIGPILQTERLRLRPIRRSDAAEFISIYGDPAVMDIRKYGVLNRAAAIQQIENIIAHWNEHGFGVFCVIDDATGTVAGECGLRWLDDGSDVELTYGLRPSFRGRGLATEAAEAAIDFGWRTLDLARIVATSRGDNHVSHRVLEKCGMHLVQRVDRSPHALAHYRIDKPTDR